MAEMSLSSEDGSGAGGGRGRANVEIRLATEADAGAISDIYNYYVARSTCTYDEEPESVEDRRGWIARHGEKYPATVAVENGMIVGWGSLSPFRERIGYRFTVENSVYVHADHHRRGIGRAILIDLNERAKKLGYKCIIAGIDGEQTASMAVMRSVGFEQCAHFKRVGIKFGRWLDVIFMQMFV
jgi:L-amino acid N-acyltransferase